MQEYPQQAQAGAQPQANQPGKRLPGALDPRNYDPRRAVDPAHVQKLVRAQAVARAKAQATSTVFLATVVSLATSAFGVVAALAWNQAIQTNLQDLTKNSLNKLTPGQAQLVYAVIVTVIAVVVILTLSRVAARLAKKSALDVAEAEQGSL